MKLYIKAKMTISIKIHSSISPSSGQHTSVNCKAQPVCSSV